MTTSATTSKSPSSLAMRLVHMYAEAVATRAAIAQTVPALTAQATELCEQTQRTLLGYIATLEYRGNNTEPKA